MAEQHQPEDEVAVDAGKSASGGGKTFLVTIIAVIVAALGTGAAIAYFFFPQIRAIVSGDDGVPVETVAEGADPVEYGEFLELQGFMVNPAGTGGRRALMVNVGLEAGDPKVLEEVTLKKMVFRDRVLAKLSSLPVEVLSDYSRRDSIKEDMLQDLNLILGEDQLTRLYFTAWILQ